MYVYSRGFAGSPSIFLTKLWASMFFPSICYDPKFGVGKSKVRIGDALQHVTPASFLRVKVIHDEQDSHVVASIPVFSFNVTEPRSVFKFLHEQFLTNRTDSEVQPTARQQSEIEALKSYFDGYDPKAPRDLVFHTSNVLRAAKHLDVHAIHHLKNTLMAMRIQTKGNLAVVFFDLKITKEEAQQLTTTEWQQMRDIDVYPLLHQWVSTSYGERGLAPIASFPISKIAMTLPKSHVLAARVNEHGLSIGPNGRPYYLPREIDERQTIEYEDLYTQAGTRADGSYALTDINEGAIALAAGTEVKVKLPKNVPVLIDWVNNKYSYTDTHGLLKVHDLMRFRTAEAPHIRILLAERFITEDHITMFTNMGRSAGVHITEFSPAIKDLEDIRGTSSFMTAKTPLDWFAVASDMWEHKTDNPKVPFSAIQTHGFGPFRPLARFFNSVAKACLENLAAVYRDYSVKTVMENLSWLIMMARYNDNFEHLEDQDLEIRRPAMEQGVDPQWKPLPIPMIDALREIGYLPHQTKVRNLLRDSPLFAIMPVQAGGGKSLLLITDILYEILFCRSNPYILLCPGHLIANYVNEVIYFTGGQLNVIPITGSVIREHGFERLQKIVESMPRNTVIVCDYDTLRYKQRAICYGTTPVTIYPVIDFLRQFSFGYAGLDESHKVKNETARTRAAMCLITDIPKIRLASGTMAHDSPSDLAMQIAALDPTLFGTRDEFNAKYGLSISSGRVMHWRPGAQEQIRRKINSRVVTAGAMRKEWAAFLPTKREWIGGVNLKPSQQLVYNAILDETLDKIEEDAKSNKELQKFFGKQRPAVRDYDPDAPDDAEEDEDDIRDEDAGSDLAALLKPYLARLERFLMAPGKDPLGAKLLNGPDLVSPKVLAIIDRIRLHLFGEVRNSKTGEFERKHDPLPGKVLIFTNNIISAEEVWELAGPELRKCGLLYKAENKMEHGARFEKMDRIRWMVGVEVSMNEGLNFQFAGRTIRPETVWNPGTLEQGNSRTNRPELKKRDARSEVFYDTLVVNRTIDITKAARLISKIIAVAKFENAGNPEFEKIPDVPIIKMSLKSIRTFNTWEYVNKEQPGLVAYAAALAEYERVREKDYEEYKQEYVAKYGEGPTKTLIEIAARPDDARLMFRVPYAPGGEIFGKQQLGAVRIDEYLNLIEDELLLDDDSDGEEFDDEEEDPEFSPLAEKAASLRGRTVHTEYGEGTISRCGVKMKYVSVRLHNGYTVRVRKSACFLLTKDAANDVRSEIAKIIDMVIGDVEEVPALAYKLSREQSKTKKLREARTAAKATRIRERDVRRALTLDLSLVLTNGYLGLTYSIAHNVTALQTLQACGFRTAPAFYYAKVPTATSLARQRDAWSAAGITVDKKLAKEGSRTWFTEMFEQLKAAPGTQDSIKGIARAKLPNFYRLKHVASKEKTVIKPYPLLENGNAYIAFPKEGQSWTKRAMRKSVNALKWSEKPATLTYFGTVDEIRQMAKRVKGSGVIIRNADALNRQFRKVSGLKVRVL